MRYWPVASVTTDRVFSISTGLVASTVTPGNTAPDASLTTPVIAACAWTAEGRSNESRIASRGPEDRAISFGIALSPRLQVHDKPAWDECRATLLNWNT